MQEQKKRRKENAAFLLRLAVFMLLFVVLSSAALYVLTPKFDYGPGSMMNFYFQPANTVDVLALGTSMTYAGVNTNVLFANWGIAAYDLASAEQQYWNTLYYLKEALKTQRPKVILLDAKAATYPDSDTAMGRAILTTCGILSPDTRLAALQETVPKAELTNYFLAFPMVHENWKMLTKESFSIPGWTGGRSINWKGFTSRDETEKHTKPTLVWTNIKKKINEREEAYFHKICDLAQEKNIPLVLVAYPNPDYAQDHMYYNALWALADERGIPHLNLNDPSGHYRFLYSSEFADWQHVNTKGSIKLSDILGAYLKERYDLPDRRGSPAYQSWQNCLTEWLNQYPEYHDALNKGE